MPELARVRSRSMLATLCRIVHQLFDWHEYSTSHRPYLSKVLAEEAHLTSSQLYALTLYWKLTEPETEFLMRLLDIEKASQAEYREYLREKI